MPVTPALRCLNILRAAMSGAGPESHTALFMKTLLHLAAFAAVQMKGDRKEFYRRKISDGKNKMRVLNAVRNELVLRIFSCVKQNQFFEKYHCCSLV